MRVRKSRCCEFRFGSDSFEDHLKVRLANAALRDEAFATKAVASFARAVRHCAVALAAMKSKHNAP